MRAFVAIELDETLLHSLRSAQEYLSKRCGDGLRMVGSEQLHLTLAFLGEINEELMNAAQAVLETCRRSHPFPIALRGAGMFPDERHPRVVWCGVQAEPGTALDTIAELVRSGLHEAQVPFDQKPFHPHITVARVKEREGDTAKLGKILPTLPLESVTQQVNSLTFFSSELTPRGARYTAVSRVYLTGQ